MRPTNNNGEVIPLYTMSWQHTYSCICFELGIEEF